MTKNPVASPGATNGVIIPPVKHFTAKTAGRVTVPDGHTKAAPHGSPEEGRGDVRVRGSRGGSEPSTRTRSSDGGKVAATSPSEGGVMHEGRNRASLKLCRERPLGGGIGLSVNTGAGRDQLPECRLSGTTAATLIKIERIKRRPDNAAEVAASSETGYVSGGSMLTGRTGSDPPRSDTQRGQTPIVVRKWRANQTAERKANVGVSIPEADGLSVRRDSTKPWPTPNKTSRGRMHRASQGTCHWHQ